MVNSVSVTSQEWDSANNGSSGRLGFVTLYQKRVSATCEITSYEAESHESIGSITTGPQLTPTIKDIGGELSLG